MDLHFANPATMAKQGRKFTCSKCPEQVKKLRRCREDRENFTQKDGALWPMSVLKGGTTYGFCPAKSTWDHALVNWYNILVIVAETGQIPDGKPLVEQDAEFIEVLAWFLPRYQQLRFAQNAEIILGGSETSKKVGKGGNPRSNNKNIRR
jgi:hypothetical protein